MYAIIRAGGKQAKVQSGDVIEIERVKGDSEKLSFEPLLVVDDEGNAVSDRDLLAKATVTAKILGESQGPKIDIFKYKNKTGYRRRQGHRQKYTQIEITEISLPGAKKKAASKTSKASDEGAAAAEPAAEKAAPEKTTAAKPAAKATAAKTTEAKSTATKTTAAKTTESKTTKAKTPAAKTTKKPTKPSEEA
jgi:large subunit ribosomal protein L21